MSSHRRKRLHEYAKAVAQFRASNQDHLFCHIHLHEFGKSVPVEDNHHTRGRVGALLTDQRFFMSLCRHCHQWVEQNRRLAAERGYLDLTHWNQPVR